MAETIQAPANQGQCTGNCMNCNIMQRQYCASQISYNNMNMMGQMAIALEALSQKFDLLEEKIDKKEETALINPIETAQ